MRVLPLDFAPRLVRRQRRVLVVVLARAHELDIVALEVDHLFGGKRPPWLVLGARRFDQLPSLDALPKLGPHFLKRSIAHGTLERVAHQVALVGHGLTLKILFPRIRERLPYAALFLLCAQRLDLLAVLLGLAHHSFRLISELLRHLLMTL